jgi:hypothetical protein
MTITTIAITTIIIRLSPSSPPPAPATTITTTTTTFTHDLVFHSVTMVLRAMAIPVVKIQIWMVFPMKIFPIVKRNTAER